LLRIIALVGLALALSGCAAEIEKFRQEIAVVKQVYTVATTATVPAKVVRPAAATFDILKGTAKNFAVYCINGNFAPAGCDVDTRRRISKFVKQGTRARIALRASVENGQPATATIYNLLVDAVTGLQRTPAATFTGG
jgi:hypothetical protein